MPAQRQLLGQPRLMSADRPLAAPPGLGRIGRDHLDAQLLHGAPKLGELSLVHLAAGLRGVPIMAAPVGVQRAEQPVAENDLPHPSKARRRALLLYKEHGVVHVVGVIHRHHQVPQLPRHPFMAAGILVQH